MYLKVTTTNYGRYDPYPLFIGAAGPRNLVRICKVIETRFYKRHGNRTCSRTMSGHYKSRGQTYKLIFAKWSVPSRRCYFKDSYGCPFKELGKKYGCHKKVSDYYCDEVPVFTKDIEEANKLIALINLCE